jgi:hypothetical protein
LTIKFVHKQKPVNSFWFIFLMILIETCFSSKIYSIIKYRLSTIVENKTLYTNKELNFLTITFVFYKRTN